MKKIILTTIIAAGISSGVLAQGVLIDLTGNTSTSPSATSSGVLFDAATSTFLNTNTVNCTLLGGTSAGSLTELATLAGANAPINLGGGMYIDVAGTTYNVPGAVANSDNYFQVLWWTGTQPTYALAVVVGDSGIFSNPTGGGGSPPSTPPGLTGMPAVTFFIPEPATFALGGLGLLSLLLFRRRK